ncbi:MAG: insulinase family protein, partial [candidate division Zixibacteria bacterium]|nr:insulinase family protein [candidate division Zixibacteria bacterium]
MLSNVKRMTLRNKMVVLLKPDNSSPLATINLRIKSGFLNEPDEFTGISHLLEHMLFKSTKKMGTNELKEKFRHLGGVFNGETMYDYTMYYCTVPKDNLRAALELEADLIYNSLFDPTELKKEKQVVIQEIKRKDDMPSIFAWEKMMEKSFTRHPFRRWRIGTAENITKMKGKDILRFHNGNYSPRNTILTIAGDFDSRKVSNWVKECFEKLRPLPLKKISFPIEPKQTSLRYQSLKGDLKQTHLKIGFHAPGVLEEDNFALVVLSYILGQGKGSRLNQILKERQGLVNSISSDLYNLKDLGVYFFELELEDKNVLSSLIEVFRQIEEIKQGKLFDLELARAKNLWRADFLSNFESLAGQADILSLFEQYGDYGLIPKFMHKIGQVSKKDIQKVAKGYLNLDKATILRYAPQKGKTVPESLGRKLTLGIKTKGPEFKPPESISFKKIKSVQKEGKSLNTELLDYGT